MRIEVRAVLKRFGKLRALDRVSLEISPGQIVSVLGANGAGKTTLLRCLAGVAGPDEGEIYFDEQVFLRERLDLRRRIMFIPDVPFLFWDKTVVRNVGIILNLFEAALPGVEQRVTELLREFDLLRLARSVVQTLSRGQVYKTAIVAMIATDPEVWLLDEPMASGMDPHALNAFRRHARAAVQRGRTILYSTQILEAAERFSDRVCLISKGEIRAFDTLACLREQTANQTSVLEGLFESLREDST